MKKISVYIVILAVLMLLTACGQKEAVSGADNSLTANSKVTPIPTFVPTPVPKASSSSGSSAGTAGQVAPTQGVTANPGSGSAVPAATTIPMFTPVPYPVSTPAAVGTDASGKTAQTSGSSAPVKTPVPVSQSTAAIISAAPAAKIKITKSPTDETVDEGGKAIFIATAENARKQVWILVSPDTKTSYKLEEAPGVFPGLSVDGQGTEKIHLYTVPYSLNGWRVQCYFEGNGGPSYTKGAYLTVKPVQYGASIFLPEDNGAGYTETNQQRAYTDAVGFGESVKRYAENGHFQSSEIQNYIYHENEKYGECQITMTRGAVTLVCTLRTYPEECAGYPQSLVWYESDAVMNTYTYGKEDSECWNHLEKTIIDITDHYGNGTAGQSMQTN